MEQGQPLQGDQIDMAVSQEMSQGQAQLMAMMAHKLRAKADALDLQSQQIMMPPEAAFSRAGSLIVFHSNEDLHEFNMLNQIRHQASRQRDKLSALAKHHKAEIQAAGGVKQHAKNVAEKQKGRFVEAAKRGHAAATPAGVERAIEKASPHVVKNVVQTVGKEGVRTGGSFVRGYVPQFIKGFRNKAGQPKSVEQAVKDGAKKALKEETPRLAGKKIKELGQGLNGPITKKDLLVGAGGVGLGAAALGGDKDSGPSRDERKLTRAQLALARQQTQEVRQRRKQKPPSHQLQLNEQ